MPRTRSQSGAPPVERVFRFNIRFLAAALGAFCGLAVFLVTNWLVIKSLIDTGKPRPVGPHLQLLSQYFIGYKVTFGGSLIGFLYGFASGALSGLLLGWIYNRIVGRTKRA